MTTSNRPLETLIRKKIVAYLRSIGALVVKYHGSPYSQAGVSDLIGSLPGGRAFFIEVKRPGNKASALQKRFLDEARNVGAVAGVVTSVDDVRRILELGT